MKFSLSSQWSLVLSFVWDFVCISFVWLTSLWEQSHTKLIQKKSHTKLRNRLQWLERLSLIFKSYFQELFSRVIFIFSNWKHFKWGAICETLINQCFKRMFLIKEGRFLASRTRPLHCSHYKMFWWYWSDKLSRPHQVHVIFPAQLDRFLHIYFGMKIITGKCAEENAWVADFSWT